MNTDENERQYRIIDQMLSMHSMLRDCYTRLALLLNIFLIAGSISLCAFVFASDNVLATLGLKPDMARVGLGLASVIVLILSVIEIRVDWNAVAGRHSQAVRGLAELKSEYRKSYSETGGNNPDVNAALGQEFQRVMKGLTPIPDRRFNGLKAKHNYKKLLSQRTSQYPKTPIWFLRLQLRSEGFREAWRKENSHVEP